MPRKRNQIKTAKVQPSMSPITIRQLKELNRLGRGKTPTEAAAYLIDKGLDEYLMAGLIGPGVKRIVKRR